MKLFSNIINLDLAKFRDAVNSKYRTSRQNRYLVNISFPNGQNNEVVDLYCMSVSIPSRNITSSPTKLESAYFEMPNGISYEPITLQFLLDENLIIRDEFVKWHKIIFDEKAEDELSVSGIGFYDDIVARITIYALDTLNNPKYGVQLINAYPKSIGDVGFTSTDSGNVNTMAVTFTYEKMTEEKKSLDKNSPRYTSTSSASTSSTSQITVTNSAGVSIGGGIQPSSTTPVVLVNSNIFHPFTNNLYV